MLPIALDSGVAAFVYCDPGRDTDKELLYWGSSHARLWSALRQAGRQIHVVTVARDHSRQQRAKKVLQRWTRSGDAAEPQRLSAEEQDTILRIEQAVHTNDQAYLAEYGGLYKAMEYRQMLIGRPKAPPPKNRIRIDQGKAWQSPRLPAEEEPSRDVLV